MGVSELVTLGQEALLLSVVLVLPVLGVTLLAGLLGSVLQTATRVHDAALSHLPRLLAVALTLAVLGPWMGGEIVALAVKAFGGG